MIKRYELSRIGIDEILSRDKAASADVEAVVAGIIADVRKNKDAALKALTAKFDGAVLSSLLVTDREILRGPRAAGRDETGRGEYPGFP